MFSMDQGVLFNMLSRSRACTDDTSLTCEAQFLRVQGWGLGTPETDNRIDRQDDRTDRNRGTVRNFTMEVSIVPQ